MPKRPVIVALKISIRANGIEVTITAIL